MLINTCCWRADHEILMHNGEAECINIRICPTLYVLISDNLPVRKSYFDSNIISRILRRFFYDYFEADVDKSTFACDLIKTRKLNTTINVIYHRFSHGPVSYTLNGENVKVMLESRIH